DLYVTGVQTCALPIFDRPFDLAAVATSGPFGPALRAIGVDRLTPQIVSDFHRTHGLIDRDGGEIEWAVDEGAIRAGGSVAPLCEIELELRRGPPGLLFDLAHRIADRL